jgi:hypothetical protein
MIIEFNSYLFTYRLISQKPNHKFGTSEKLNRKIDKRQINYSSLVIIIIKIITTTITTMIIQTRG